MLIGHFQKMLDLLNESWKEVYAFNHGCVYSFCLNCEIFDFDVLCDLFDSIH